MQGQIKKWFPPLKTWKNELCHIYLYIYTHVRAHTLACIWLRTWTTNKSVFADHFDFSYVFQCMGLSTIKDNPIKKYFYMSRFDFSLVYWAEYMNRKQTDIWIPEQKKNWWIPFFFYQLATPQQCLLLNYMCLSLPVGRSQPPQTMTTMKVGDQARVSGYYVCYRWTVRENDLVAITQIFHPRQKQLPKQTTCAGAPGPDQLVDHSVSCAVKCYFINSIAPRKPAGFSEFCNQEWLP